MNRGFRRDLSSVSEVRVVSCRCPGSDERTSMKNRLTKIMLGVAAIAALALGGAALATGAGTTSQAATTTTGTGTTARPARTPETPLTGDVATQAKAAAVAEVGGTADLATTETDSSNSAAAYEVHVTKADGTHATVILDKRYSVLTVETGNGHGGPPPLGG